MSRKLQRNVDKSMLPDMVGAVIYVRVSTKEQTENLSLSTQLKACEDYCERQAFHVLARFREEGESAKTVDRTETAEASAVLPHEQRRRPVRRRLQPDALRRGTSTTTSRCARI